MDTRSAAQGDSGGATDRSVSCARVGKKREEMMGLGKKQQAVFRGGCECGRRRGYQTFQIDPGTNRRRDQASGQEK